MKERQSNLELLRIILIIGVIILHINNASIGGAFSMVEKQSIRYYVLYTLESISIVAVNLFMMISGYFLINSNKRNIWKPIELLFQVIFLAVIKYLISSCIFGNEFSIKSLIRCLIPSNYFVILYIVVFVVSPFINILIEVLNDKKRKLLLLLLICIFSIYPTMVDIFQEIAKNEFYGLSTIGMYGSQYGYSIINFLLCYIIGAYINIYKDKVFDIKTKRLFLYLLINVMILTIWAIINDYIGFNIERSAWEYCNPIIIFNAVVIFALFNKLTFTSKTINDLARCTFTVFLCHDALIKKEIVEKIICANPIIMLGEMLLYSILIYMLLYLVNKIYLIINKIVFSRIEKKYNLSIQF